MNNPHTHIKFVFLIAFLFLALTQLSSAVTIGVSPSKIIILQAQNGSLIYKDLTVSSNFEENLLVHVHKADCQKFLQVQDSFILNSSTPQKLKVNITIPSDTPQGNYSCTLRMITRPLAYKGLSVSLSLLVPVSVHVQNLPHKSFEVLSSRIEEGSLFFTIKNTGNSDIHIKQLRVDFFNRTNKALLQSHNLSVSIISRAYVKEDFHIPAPMLPVGSFWATLHLEGFQSKMFFVTNSLDDSHYTSIQEANRNESFDNLLTAQLVAQQNTDTISNESFFLIVVFLLIFLLAVLFIAYSLWRRADEQ